MENEKKAYLKKGWFWIAVVLLLILVANLIGSNANTQQNSNSNKKTSKVQNIYQNNDLLVRITNYEYLDSFDQIKFDVYIENNSEKDISFTIDGNVSINEYTVGGGYFYQTVNSKTKLNTNFKVKNLKTNGITKETLKEMKFKLDIYHSKNYFIDETIEDDLQINYKF